MELRDYLHVKRMSVTDFAAKCDAHRNYMSQIMNYRMIPSPKLCRIIEIASEGEVKKTDIIEAYEMHNKKEQVENER